MSENANRPKKVLPSRRELPHGVFEFAARPTIVFVTACTEDRVPALACPAIHDLLPHIWSNEATAWLVGRYVVMPDHLHLFASPGPDSTDLDAWIRFWKSLVTKRQANSGWRWQRGHWDTRLRHGESYEQKWQYVVDNPVRAGLVPRAADWAYQGEVFELRW